MRYGFELAQSRDNKITSVTKSNALLHSMVFWDKVFAHLIEDYPNVVANSMLVDAMAMHLILAPENFDVVVTSNLFGDILSDLGAALIGGLGFAPSANLNPDEKYPPMFEPVHGSSPGLAGRKIANPIAAIWAGSMMLDYLGEREWSRELLAAIEAVLLEGRIRTADIGGYSTTDEMGDAICENLRQRVSRKGG